MPTILYSFAIEGNYGWELDVGLVPLHRVYELLTVFG
jgi:hypothetical protein